MVELYSYLMLHSPFQSLVLSLFNVSARRPVAKMVLVTHPLPLETLLNLFFFFFVQAVINL